MKILIIASLMLAGLTANAERFYYIEGSQVSKGEAVIKSLQDPGIAILAVDVSWKRASKQSANLRKQTDARIKDIPNCD